MQMEGGTAAVGVFRFEDHDNMIQCQSECSFSNCGVDILVARNVMETIQFGCHVRGSLWKRKSYFLNTFA